MAMVWTLSSCTTLPNQAQNSSDDANVKADNDAAHTDSYSASAEDELADEEELKQEEFDTDALLSDVKSSEAAHIPPVTPVTEDPSLWSYMQARFEIEPVDNKRVEREVKKILKYKKHLYKVTRRAAPYMHHIVSTFEEYDLPIDLALLPAVESGYNPYAYSPAHASGLWQFMPATGRIYGLSRTRWYDSRRDVASSTLAAARFLKDLGKEFDNDWLLSLAAYNAGPGAVRKAIKKNIKRGRPVDFWHLDLPKETKSYVPRLLAYQYIINNADLLNVKLHPIDNEPFFKRVALSEPTSISRIAKAAEMSLRGLKSLNPGFRTGNTGPHNQSILLPIEKTSDFTTKLAAQPKIAATEYALLKHKIKPGETLGHIAQKYAVSTKQLRATNKLRGNRIRAGKYLLIPTKLASLADFDTPTNGARKISYRIKSGDSLWKIAKQHKITTKELARWNGLSTRTRIKPGKSLTIWLDEKPYTGNVSAVKANYKQPTKKSQKRASSFQYTVQSGDTLWDIARLFNTSSSNIKRWNKLSSSRSLRAGQTLTIKLDSRKKALTYVVKAGDSLSEIASTFNLTVKDIMRWNKHIKSRSRLRAGQKLQLKLKS